VQKGKSGGRTLRRSS